LHEDAAILMRKELDQAVMELEAIDAELKSKSELLLCLAYFY